MKKPKLIPFGYFTMLNGKRLDVMILTADSEGKGYLKFEVPDKIYGFKSCKITYPNLVIEEVFGFDDDDLAWIVQLCKNNLRTIKEIGETGEIYDYA